MTFDFSIIVWLFPIIFMLHEFEEIIFMEYWISKNKGYIAERFPKMSKRFLSRFENLSTSAFTVAVAEEFILLSIITIVSVKLNTYLLWLGIFMGFFVHLFIHFMQWIIMRRYIPSIFTTFISLGYCIISLSYIIRNNIFQIKEILLWTIIGFGIIAINLILAHKLASWFDKSIKR